MTQIQIDGLSTPHDARRILCVTRIDEKDVEKPYIQFSFDGGPELEELYNRQKGRNLNCSLGDLREAIVLVEEGSSPAEVLSKFIV